MFGTHVFSWTNEHIFFSRERGPLLHNISCTFLLSCQLHSSGIPNDAASSTPQLHSTDMLTPAKNTRRMKAIVIALGAVLIFLLVTNIEWMQKLPANTNTPDTHTNTLTHLNNNKKMCYMIMGADLPSQPLMDALLTTDNSTVLSCLTFKTNASRCFFFPVSTWTTGRNKLWEESKKAQQEQGYECYYYIFLGMHTKTSTHTALTH